MLIGQTWFLLHPPEVGDASTFCAPQGPGVGNGASLPRRVGLVFRGRAAWMLGKDYTVDFNGAGESGRTAGLAVSPSHSQNCLQALGLMSFTASAHLCLLPCSHDTPVFPPEVAVNGLLRATINGIS